MNKDKVVELTERLVEILKEGEVWITGASDDLEPDCPQLDEAIDILSQLEEEFDG